MDKKLEILLNSQKNIASVAVDTYDKLELRNKPVQITEYNIRNVLSATEVFDAEREANPVYRIYGKVEYMSLLNGLKTQYKEFSDFFNPQITGNSKNILNSFDFYLVRPYTGFTNITNYSTQYIRYFQVIAKPSDFELYPVGFANNLYGEQAYAFNFNKDFDVSYYRDNFDFPATELFLYAQYKPGLNYYGDSETMKYTVWNSTTGVRSQATFTPLTLNIGDTVHTSSMNRVGDLVEYSKPLFYQEQLSPQTFYITTKYRIGGSTIKTLVWKYNPFIPFRLRYFTNNLYKINTGSTSYEEVQTIPYYATNLGDGNMVWRDIMAQGYIDPLTGEGVDYPFINKKRYLFSSIILDIIPDLSDAATLAAFSQVWFSDNAVTANVAPTGDINNIGKPCQ